MWRSRGHAARRAWLRCFALTCAAFLLLTAGASAEPPVLDSVGYSPLGQATARFTLRGDAEADRFEVAKAPDVGADGGFLPANVVVSDLIDDPFADYWRSEVRLPPGTYYVHVSAVTFCDVEENCVEKTEWSNVRTLVVPPPKPGRYSGRTFFGQKISFVVPKNAKTIRKLTAEYEVVCTRASAIFRVKFKPIPVRDLAFEKSLKVRFRGGGYFIFKLRGTLKLNGRASGRLFGNGRVPRAGRCHEFGNPDWSARRK